MPKPYSVDLRERVVMAVEDLGLSRRQAAAHFGVSYSSAILWVSTAEQNRSKGRRKTGPFSVMRYAVLRVVPLVHRRAPRCFA